MNWTCVGAPIAGKPGANDTRRFEMVGAFGDGPEPPPQPLHVATRRTKPSGRSPHSEPNLLEPSLGTAR
jgi:hypothetical protein